MNNPYAPPHSHVTRPLAFPIPAATAPLPAMRARADASRGRRVGAVVVAVGLLVVLFVVGFRAF